MAAQVVSYGQFGGVLPGPSSRPDSDTGHDWLDDRDNATFQDAAFAAEGRQQLTKQLGETEWDGEGQTSDRAPMLEGDRFQRDVGSRLSLATQRRSEGRERAGLAFNVHDAGVSGMSAYGNVTGQQPVKSLFRGMREDEWQQAQAQGYIQSDGRGAIDPDWEGTNFSTNIASANSYMPRDTPGRIIKIDHNPADQFFTATSDDYARTRARVPLDRVTAVSDQYNYGQLGGLNLRDSVVKSQKEGSS